MEVPNVQIEVSSPLHRPIRYTDDLGRNPSTDHRPPAPEAWQAEIKTGYGEVESKVRFPLLHTRDCNEISTG